MSRNPKKKKHTSTSMLTSTLKRSNHLHISSAYIILCIFVCLSCVSIWSFSVPSPKKGVPPTSQLYPMRKIEWNATFYGKLRFHELVKRIPHKIASKWKNCSFSCLTLTNLTVHVKEELQFFQTHTTAWRNFIMDILQDISQIDASFFYFLKHWIYEDWLIKMKSFFLERQNNASSCDNVYTIRDIFLLKDLLEEYVCYQFFAFSQEEKKNLNQMFLSSSSSSLLQEDILLVIMFHQHVTLWLFEWCLCEQKQNRIVDFCLNSFSVSEKINNMRKVHRFNIDEIIRSYLIDPQRFGFHFHFHSLVKENKKKKENDMENSSVVLTHSILIHYFTRFFLPCIQLSFF